MKSLFALVLSIYLVSCEQADNKSDKTTLSSMGHYNTFDKDNHLQPLFDKASFDTLHSWEFGWAVLEPINVAKTKEDDKKLAKRLSPGQKALYFFWYLDAEVTNGGFIQFYWNYNREYLPPIIDGLKLIGDTSMLDLVTKADKEYLIHKDKFESQRQKDDWEPLYENLKKFDDYDSIYYKIHDKTMELLESYARQHPADFVKFK